MPEKKSSSVDVWVYIATLPVTTQLCAARQDVAALIPVTVLVTASRRAALSEARNLALLALMWGWDCCTAYYKEERLTKRNQTRFSSSGMEMCFEFTFKFGQGIWVSNQMRVVLDYLHNLYDCLICFYIFLQLRLVFMFNTGNTNCIYAFVTASTGICQQKVHDRNLRNEHFAKTLKVLGVDAYANYSIP